MALLLSSEKQNAVHSTDTRGSCGADERSRCWSVTWPTWLGLSNAVGCTQWSCAVFRSGFYLFYFFLYPKSQSQRIVFRVAEGNIGIGGRHYWPGVWEPPTGRVTWCQQGTVLLFSCAAGSTAKACDDESLSAPSCMTTCISTHHFVLFFH